jgi:hypothetical protein
VLELAWTSWDDIRNEGSVRARDGGILRISGGIHGGEIVVADSASRLEVESNVSNSVIRNSAGGRSEFRSFCSLNGATLEGIHHVTEGARLNIYSTLLINNGNLVVNPSSAAPAAKLLPYPYVETLFEGTGTVLLNAPPEDLGMAEFGEDRDDAHVTTLGPQQTLTGTGRVWAECVNEGTLSPGGNNGPIGVIELKSHEWVQAATAALVIDVSGTQPQQYDRIVGDATVVLGGALVVRLVNGFSPAVGDEFSFLDGPLSSGEFSRIEGPAAPGGLWQVFRRDWSLVLTLTCATDLNGDRETSLADLAILLGHFGATTDDPRDGDIDANRRVELQDLARLLAAIGGPCD